MATGRDSAAGVGLRPAALGLYVRGELERDTFEDIDLRSTIAAGLSWRPINTETQMLKFYTGVGYRHESFKSGLEDHNSTMLDIGLNHRWIVKPWLTMLNSLSYTPAVDDFGNYLFVQDSAIYCELHKRMTSDGRSRLLPDCSIAGGNVMHLCNSQQMPVGTGRRWLLRVGVRNDYNSEPAPDKDSLDTAYYTRLLLKIE